MRWSYCYRAFHSHSVSNVKTKTAEKKTSPSICKLISRVHTNHRMTEFLVARFLVPLRTKSVSVIILSSRSYDRSLVYKWKRTKKKPNKQIVNRSHTLSSIDDWWRENIDSNNSLSLNKFDDSTFLIQSAYVQTVDSVWWNTFLLIVSSCEGDETDVCMCDINSAWLILQAMDLLYNADAIYRDMAELPPIESMKPRELFLIPSVRLWCCDTLRSR